LRPRLELTGDRDAAFGTGQRRVLSIQDDMKRKKSASPTMVTAETLIAIPAGASAFRKPAKRGKCVICGEEAAPFSDENLCWVCRRLKISAWKDAESQPSMQE